MNEFLQLRPWTQCSNKCSFCSVDCNQDIDVNYKQKAILKTIEVLNRIDLSRYNRIGLIGGEFFEGQLKGCEEQWYQLIDYLNNTTVDRIFITANLIYNQYLLFETIEKLKKPLTICTSYDTVGRFKLEKNRQSWFKNINILHNMEVPVCCTCIPTEDFLLDKVEFPDWLFVNLCEPHNGVKWYMETIGNCDENQYHKKLIEDNDKFNLPKRKTFLRWGETHPSILKNFSNYNVTHSSDIYYFDGENYISEMKNRLHDTKYIQECGHPKFSKCYSDSNHCIICDAKAILENL